MSLAGVQVGQTVFVYDTANGARMGSKGEELQVTKVTKQTVYVNQYRKTLAFNIETGYQKQDAWCHLRAWKSREDFDAETDRQKAWSDLRASLNFGGAPDHLTTEQIKQMIATLKGERA